MGKVDGKGRDEVKGWEEEGREREGGGGGGEREG